MSGDKKMNPVTEQYFSPQPYYSTANAESPTSFVSPVQSTEPTQRKRPKYTRSKTGCMTCRVKKVKCDESKPICMRCTHGARECSWPEAIPSRKRTSSKKDFMDERPSTSGSVAESTGVSESPPSSGREQTPPCHSLVDLSPVSPSSMYATGKKPIDDSFLSDTLSDSYESTYYMSPDPNARPIYPQQHSHSYPVTSAMHYTPRYENHYANSDSQTVACGMPSSYRQQPLPQANPIYWNTDLDNYYYNHRVSLQENMPAGQSSSPDPSHYRFDQYR